MSSSRWPVRAVLTISLLLVAAGCPATSQQGGTQVEVQSEGASPPPALPAGAPQSATAPSTADEDFPEGLADDVKQYLGAVHRLIGPEWDQGVRARAAAMLPPDHPANQLKLLAEVSVFLDLHGQPAGQRVSRSSGYQPFDDSALQVMGLARKLPPLPASLGEGVITLVWRFHRDERSCNAAHAQLLSKPLGRDEAMRRALLRGRLQEALRILRSGPASPALLQLIAGAGLIDPDPAIRRLALQIASPAQIDAVVVRAQQSAASWRMVLAALAARQETGKLLELLAEHASSKLDPARLVDLIDALAWIEARPPTPVLIKLLERAEAAVVVAAAALVTSPGLLDAPLRRHQKTPAVQGPLLVRKRALTQDPAVETAIRSLLAGPEVGPTLEALARYGVKAFDAELEAMVRTARTPPAARARAIEIIAERQPSLGALYAAIRDGDAAVQIAGARALGRARGNPIAVSFRLAELASRARGQAQAEALVALARIGDERFREDTLRRARLLDARGQALVAAALRGYGDEAVPTLSRMLAHSAAEVRAAAAATLSQLGTEKARQALAAQPSAQPAAPAPSPLHALLLEAVQLARGSRR